MLVSYPVTFEADYVESRNRLTTFFRLILAIPLVIWLVLYGIVAELAIVVAWFAIVITGEYPRGLYDFVAGFTRFATRTLAYTALLCDPYPSFGGAEDPAYPVRMEFERARALRPPEDPLSHHPRDPDPDPALRHGPDARDRRGRGLVRDPGHGQNAARLCST